MNVDLRELMTERSADAAATVRTDRVVEVRRRIGRVRRRRAAVAVAGTCAVLAAVAASTTLLPGRPAPQPAATLRTIDGFAEYSKGAKVIATGVAELPVTEVSVTVVPETLELTVATRCDPEMGMMIRVNGHDLYGSDCGEYSEPSVIYVDAPTRFGGLGVSVGQPATFTLEVTHVNDYTESGRVERPLPESGSLALAVMQRVPFDEFPLPPRPETLPPLEAGLDDALVLSADLIDPLRPAQATIAWDPDAIVQAQLQTPGYLHISINGIPVMTHEEWGYEAGIGSFRLGDAAEFVDPDLTTQLQLPMGTPVTITVEPEHVTGGWGLWLVPPAAAEPA
jgi:hypothetical protein